MTSQDGPAPSALLGGCLPLYHLCPPDVLWNVHIRNVMFPLCRGPFHCANYIVHPSTSDQVVVVVKPLQQGVSVDHLAVPSATLDSELMCAQVSDA